MQGDGEQGGGSSVQAPLPDLAQCGRSRFGRGIEDEKFERRVALAEIEAAELKAGGQGDGDTPALVIGEKRDHVVIGLTGGGAR
ncbi:MAG: hypothetical protein RML45_12395 [Acetobacteraceae bacterium]|nr:hypothetical protein [Acetobacteraceae bacterium]